MGAKSKKKAARKQNKSANEAAIKAPISADHAADEPSNKEKLPKKVYEKELARLQIELVKLQETIKRRGLKVVVVFEGRDAAGSCET